MNDFAGIDGCRGGWFAVVGEHRWKAELVPSLDHFWDHNQPLKLVLVDIPLGIEGERDCERLARKMLPPQKRSSVFNPPVKEALNIKDYGKASQINHDFSGKKLSKQSFYLMPKIREANDFLIAHKQASMLFYESHPELCFARMTPKVLPNKKTFQGRKQRLDILKNADPQMIRLYHEAVHKYKRKWVNYDDILDALVLAFTARKGVQGLQFLPQKAQYTQQGLRMQLAF